MKAQKQSKKFTGVIDKSFTEIKLGDFLKDNPNLISDLKKKYKI